MNPDNLATYLKSFENMDRIPGDQSFIVRLDGHGFSKWTKSINLVKPCDERFKMAMIKTTADLLTHFLPATGYTHSDEITLVFPPAKDHRHGSEKSQEHIFGGRVQKIISLISSYTSIRFNFYMNVPGQAYFDCRLIQYSPEDIVKHQIWRSSIDCYRNCVSNYCHTYISNHKLLQKMDTRGRIELLKSHGIDISNLSPYELHGVYLKKVPIQLTNPAGIMYERRRIATFYNQNPSIDFLFSLVISMDKDTDILGQIVN